MSAKYIPQYIQEANTDEDTHASIPESSSPEILKSLMEAHSLKQSDLREIGSHGVVSEILSGKRELNILQIILLAKRFSVSPAVFCWNDSKSLENALLSF